MPHTQPPHTVSEAASAKVNLYLHVLGRRADGYHELSSLVMFADCGDVVTVQANPALPAPELQLEGPYAAALVTEPPETNLVLRAVRALSAACNRAPAVQITLGKHLPIASGIGGGSADAAATLRALATLWALPQTDPRLYAAAAGLGADVPACLVSRPCYFVGIGDSLLPAPPLPDLPAVLVNPGVPLATPTVFRTRTGAFAAEGPPPLTFDETADAATLIAALARRRNDLTAAAIALVPEITTALAVLEAAAECRLARMSGSGATVFGLFPSLVAATLAAAAIQAAHPDWWVRSCRLQGSLTMADRRSEGR